MNLRRYLTSFRGKLTVLVAASVLIPMLLSSALLGGMLQKRLHRSTEERLRANLQSFSLLLKNREEKLTGGLAGMAADNTLQMTLELGIAPQLTKYVESNARALGFTGVTIFDAEGKQVAQTGRSAPRAPMGGRMYLAADEQGVGLYCSKKIRRGNNLLGYVQGFLSLTEQTFLDELASRLTVPYAMWTDGSLFATDLKARASLAKWPLEKPGTVAHAPLDGESFWILTESIQLGKHRLAYGLVHDFADVRREFGLLVAVIAAIVLCLFGIIELFLRRFVKELVTPVTQLTAAARSIERGEELPELDVHRADEFGRMASAFRKMVRTLEQRIEEQEKAEQALRASEERFRALTEDASDLFFIIDLSGRFTYVSPSVRNLAYTTQELIGRSPLEFMPPNDRDVLEQAILQIKGQPKAKTALGPLRVLNGKGDGVWLEGSLTCLGHEPSIAGIVINARDITQRIHAEQELEETNRKLVATAREVGMAEVATGVLHNVGNVLNSVMVTTETVHSKLHNSCVGDLVAVMNLVKSHQQDLAAFLTKHERGQAIPAFLGELAAQLAKERQDLLAEMGELRKYVAHLSDIVRLQQEHARPDTLTETVRLQDLTDDAIQMNARGMAQSEITVIREYEQLPPVVLDRHKTLQILVNLLANAIQALRSSTQTHKQVIVKILKPDSGHVRIAVTDNGTGISPEHQKRLFSHGFTTKEKGHGFGLHSGALAARDMGATLRAHSDGEGTGAIFELEIPIPAQDDENEHGDWEMGM